MGQAADLGVADLGRDRPPAQPGELHRAVAQQAVAVDMDAVEVDVDEVEGEAPGPDRFDLHLDVRDRPGDEQAAETVSAWVKAVPKNKQPCYHEAAWCLAQCVTRATKQGKNADSLAGRAVELLRKAAGQGTLEGRFLAKKEFDPLRERNDFKQIERSLTRTKWSGSARVSANA